MPKRWSRSKRARGTSGGSLPLVILALFLVAWEFGSQTGRLSMLFFSSPSRIAVVGWDTIQTADFWHDVSVSGQEFLIGYLLALAVAVPFGLLTGWFKPVQHFFDPWLNALNSTPRIALLPLVVLWFGLGLASKVAIVFLGVFVSVAINTAGGVRTVDRSLLDVARTYNASTMRRFRTIVLPSALPFILVGMRLGVGRAVAGVMVGEYFTSQAGLGNYIFRAGQTLQTDKLLFGAVFITLLSLIGFYVLSLAEERFSVWRPDIESA